MDWVIWSALQGENASLFLEASTFGELEWMIGNPGSNTSDRCIPKPLAENGAKSVSAPGTQAGLPSSDTEVIRSIPRSPQEGLIPCL